MQLNTSPNCRADGLHAMRRARWATGNQVDGIESVWAVWGGLSRNSNRELPWRFHARMPICPGLSQQFLPWPQTYAKLIRR